MSPQKPHKSILVSLLCIYMFCLDTQAQESNGCTPSFHSVPMLRDVEYTNFNPNNRSTTSRNIRAKAGTSGGVTADMRSIFEFDLSQFDSTITVDSAFLYLYSAVSSTGNTHGQEDGPNDAYLRRVFEPWVDSTVCWNLEPAVTTSNEYYMAPTTSNTEDREHMDVTNLVQDMIANPSTSHGFHFQLNTESPYRRMIFGSSDNIDSTLHPKLHIYVCEEDSTTGIAFVSDENLIQANFTYSGSISIATEFPHPLDVRVFDVSGNLLLRKTITQRATWHNDWPAGMYIIIATDDSGKTNTQQVVKPTR